MSWIKNTIISNQYAIFDMDGTLIDTNPWLSKICERYLAERQLPPNDEFKNIAAELTFTEFCQLIKDYAGDKNPLEDTINEIQEYTTYVYTECDILAKPNVKVYLEKLKQNGVKMCVASATEEYRIKAVLSRLGLWDYFEFAITVSQVGCNKSKPDIFIEAAKRLGANNYADVTVYEDVLVAMKAAKSEGFRVVGVYDIVGEKYRVEAQQLCDVFIEDFGELL